MKTLFDSSVLIAGLVADHPAHQTAATWLGKCHSGDRRLLVASHGLAEIFAVLTSLPLSPRITPETAQSLIRENVLRVADIIELPEDDYRQAMDRMVELDLTSGAIYDALHVQAAEKSGADELVTFNGQDFRRMPPRTPCQLIVL